MDFTKYSAYLCYISSHGKFGKFRPGLFVGDIIEALSQNKSLTGKPKIIIQLFCQNIQRPQTDQAGRPFQQRQVSIHTSEIPTRTEREPRQDAVGAATPEERRESPQVPQSTDEVEDILEDLTEREMAYRSRPDSEYVLGQEV